MRRFGLIGKTLKHSFSQKYFAEKFASEKIIGCSYENFELPSIDQLPLLLNENPEIEGLNITIPYKEEVVPFLDHKDEIVLAIGACNCIRIINKKLYGYNTDSPAFQSSLEKELKKYHSSALVLGSGGASKAVQYALGNLGIDFKIVSRSHQQEYLGYDELTAEIIKSHPVIINTTPVGMFPHIETEVPIPYQYLNSRHLLFDLVYNPLKTRFLVRGEEKGAQIKNGLEMLELQAEESWKIWNGLKR